MWGAGTAGTRSARSKSLSEHGIQLSRNLVGPGDTRDKKMGHETI